MLNQQRLRALHQNHRKDFETQSDGRNEWKLLIVYNSILLSFWFLKNLHNRNRHCDHYRLYYPLFLYALGSASWIGSRQSTKLIETTTSPSALDLSQSAFFPLKRLGEARYDCVKFRPLPKPEIQLLMILASRNGNILNRYSLRSFASATGLCAAAIIPIVIARSRST